jgi:hypothetical protein
MTLTLPELICSKGTAEPEENCFDMLKLRHVNETFAENFEDYYFSLFPYTRISVREIYPGNQTWILYEKEKPDYTSIEPTRFVVSLKNEVNGTTNNAEYALGVLTVEVYQ